MTTLTEADVEQAALGNAGGGWLILGVTHDRQPQSLDPSQLDAFVRFVGEICTDSISLLSTTASSG